MSPFSLHSRSCTITKVRARFQLTGLALQLLSQAVGIFSHCLSLGLHVSRTPLNFSLPRSVAELAFYCHPLTPSDVTDVWFAIFIFRFLYLNSGYGKFLKGRDPEAARLH